MFVVEVGNAGSKMRVGEKRVAQRRYSHDFLARIANLKSSKQVQLHSPDSDSGFVLAHIVRLVAAETTLQVAMKASNSTAVEATDLDTFCVVAARLCACVSIEDERIR